MVGEGGVLVYDEVSEREEFKPRAEQRDEG